MRSDLRKRAVSSPGLLVALLSALAMTSACETPTAPGENPAYDPTRLTDGRLYRWTLGAAVAIHVDTTGQGATSQGSAPRMDLRASVERGLAGWTATWRYGELRPRLVDSAAEADVVVQYTDAPPLVAWDVCTSSIATSTGRTVLCAAGDTARTLPLTQAGVPGRVKIAIVIDHAMLSRQPALDAIVAHELGHAFGIGGHSPDAADLMYAAPTSLAPSRRDAATLRYVLHRPASLKL